MSGGRSSVRGNATVSGSASIYDEAVVYGKATVTDSAAVSGSARISGNAAILERAIVCDYSTICGNAEISGIVQITGQKLVSLNASISTRDQVISAEGFGSTDHGIVTAFRLRDGGVGFTRGCFEGSKEDFLEASERTHGKGSDIYEECRILLDLLEFRLNNRAKARDEA